MYNVVTVIKFLDAKNCFLHLSPKIFSKFSQSLPCGVKLTRGNDEFYFSIYPYPCKNINENNVGLNSTYASKLKIDENDCVVLCPLSSLSSVEKIFARPLTSDDLEILEVVAGIVEASLLSQLRVVWKDQQFTVWVSGSVCVTLVVDSLEPEIKYGRLDDSSEIVVGDVSTPNSNVTPIRQIKERDSSDMNFAKPQEDEPDCKSLVARIAPVEDLAHLKVKGVSPAGHHPYKVYLLAETCPEGVKARLAEEPTSVWEIRSSDDLSTVTKESLTVNLCLLGPNEKYLTNVGRRRTLFVSRLVKKHLSIFDGAKVLLNLTETARENIRGLLVSTCFDLKEEEVLYFENYVHKTFLNIILTSGNCLLNSKCGFILDSEKTVIITLRPLDLKWGFLSLPVIRTLSISINPISSDSDKHFCIDQTTLQAPSNFLKLIGEEILSNMTLSVDHSLHLKKGLINYNPPFMDNVLITGKSGCGKSCFSKIFCYKMSQNPYYLHIEHFDARVLKGKRIENVAKLFTDVLNSCKSHQPSILLLEDIDILCSKLQSEHEKTEASFHIHRIALKLFDLIESYQKKNCIFVIATASSSTSLNEILIQKRGKSLFSTIIKIPDLSKMDRREFLESCIKNKIPSMEKTIDKIDIDFFAAETEGFVAGDLVKFVEKAMFEAWQRTAVPVDELILCDEDLKTAHKSSCSFVYHNLKIHKNQKLKIEHIGGLKDAIEKISEIVLWPSKYPHILSQCPLRRQSAMLLFGAPGSGKTILARAVAGESGLNFITVKGPELMSKYIGESEEGVRRVFENAHTARPCLLFFDEFESLAPRRGHEQTGVTDRVVNQLLTALDGVEPMTGVVVMAASSRPDIIDPALLRPGRIGTHVYCPFPDKTDRIDILKKLTSEIQLSEDIDLEEISNMTDGFSGADLKGLITTTQLHLVDNLVGSSLEVSGSIFKNMKKTSKIVVTRKDMLKGLEESKPSLGTKEREKYEKIYASFMNGSSPDMSLQKVTFA